MRGDPTRQAEMLLGSTPDSFVPVNHPIRAIKPLVDGALAELSPVFEEIYSRVGRPSIPPEHLLKAQLLMALFSVRSARQFCEQLQYNMLFKWFLDLNVGDRAFDASTFSKNQERLLSADVARRFLGAVVEEARRRRLLSDEHFTADGTLLDAWASMKSLRPVEERDDGPPTSRGRNPSVDFRGQRRTNDTHRSTTDPEARLMRKSWGEATRLCFAGHVLMDNAHGLVVDVELTPSVGITEWSAALQMLDRLPVRRRRATLAGDKGYDNKAFVRGCRERRVTPRVAQWPTTVHRRSAIDRRTTRHAGYTQSQRVRKRVEEIFGWWKTVAGGRKLRFIGVGRNRVYAQTTMAAYNLLRMAHLEQRAGRA